MKLREAAPVRHTRGPAFVTSVRGCTLADIRTPSFALASEARALAERRLELGLGLRDAAIRLGIRAIELSGLEHGRLVPENPGDWAAAINRLGP